MTIKHNSFLLLIIIATLFTACKKKNNTEDKPLFASVPSANVITPLVAEISGIAASAANPGYIWAHEDSGTPTQLYLVGNNGSVAKKIFIKKTTNRDWEEMALVQQDIYIAETGDNNQAYTNYRFYKFPEPLMSADTVFAVDTISFTYPDGSHDSEAFLVDATTRDIFIITKRDIPSRIYKLSFPYTANMVASLEGNLGYSGVTGATISPDQSEIMLRTYSAIHYYKRAAGQTIAQALASSFTALQHQSETQGEALCFSRDGSGYYTVSEKAFANAVNLYFYQRN